MIPYSTQAFVIHLYRQGYAMKEIQKELFRMGIYLTVEKIRSIV